jgi:hypothetical protein
VKEVSMDIQWRTVQLFLESFGVVEVEVDQDNHSKIRCTCPVFNKQAKCKHVRHVKDVMNDNNGHYSIQIPVDVDETLAITAMKTAEGFRDFVIKYGKVEVID